MPQGRQKIPCVVSKTWCRQIKKHLKKEINMLAHSMVPWHTVIVVNNDDKKEEDDDDNLHLLTSSCDPGSSIR